MNVAYTKAANRGQKRLFKNGSVTKTKHIAHIPEGTGFTLCGARVDHIQEVDDDADIATCGSCKSRLQAMEHKKPGSVNRFLVGNPQLPGPII